MKQQVAQRKASQPDARKRVSSAGASGQAISPSNRTGLPDGLKNGVQALSGFSLDDVRVHFNSSKPAQLQALAYTQGTDIHVAPGQERHLPHEAWHVVQQKQGRVQATMQMQDGVSVNDDGDLEHEADVMGTKATLQRKPYHAIAHAKNCGCSTCHTLQPIQKYGKTIQMLKVTDQKMATVAGIVQGDSTHSTTAITKEGNGTYKVYAQQKTDGMDDRIANYDNLYTGATNGAQYGFHAEVLALAEDLSWSKIAASQPICMRCQAIIEEQGKTAVNPGDQYTSYWQAPGDYNISGASPYPAAADHGGGDGSHGTRWTRKSKKTTKYEDGAWQEIHSAPW